MIVSCPHCDTKFNLPAEMLGDDGRRVRCTKCEEVWFQRPVVSEGEYDDGLFEGASHDDQDLNTSTDEKVSQEDVAVSDDQRSQVSSVTSSVSPSKRAVIGGYVAATTVFFIVLIIVFASKNALVRTWPASMSLYQAFGMEVSIPGEGRVFDRISLQPKDDGYFLSAHVVNLKSTPQQLPYVVAYALSDDGNSLGAYDLSKAFVSAEGSVLIEAFVNLDNNKDTDKLMLKFALDKVGHGKKEGEYKTEGHDDEHQHHKKH